ncbi:hypothetical protein DAPK24_052480 [Pichia kluyveri]|uniref:Transporter n=1 Tax=Pichia kluyveri TaxID=36015 RepID=A0AAV5RBB4_PICKL|nr:hypothetical protein DAPK24_052480 [Pichia kluyveri]
MVSPIPPQPLFTVLNEARNGISFTEITFLTFQAVIQVFLICLSGFWASNVGLLNNEGIKTISRLNVDLFTPALIFSKLASSLSLKKLFELILIPILYAITTFVSYISSILISKWFDLTEPESNFVIAMSVFGNSNSLPVSLTLALAYSLPDLEWDDVVDDTPDKIASRGLIYLLIFQQLGQMLRWSWGYNKLLSKQPNHVIFYNDYTIDDINEFDSLNDIEEFDNNTTSTNNNSNSTINKINRTGFNDNDNTYIYDNDDDASPNSRLLDNNNDNININNIEQFDHNTNNITESEEDKDIEISIFKKIINCILSFMNPPLWSILFAVIVASIPQLKAEFYENDGFIQHTISSAIKQLGLVSIPLILVVLGANLAPNSDIPPASPHYKKMILGSLLGRMVFPSIILLPLIVLCVKYIKLSIMDDPIFLITSFLLITSPPAIQLSQICQLNELYQKEMAGVLFYGYAILTLPVTIIVVVTCIEAMKWTQA